MGRIRKIAGPGYVPETTSYARCVVPQEAPEIVVCVRGQAFRIGGRGEHYTGLPAAEFEEILESIVQNVVLPRIRQGYKVLIVGDIVSDEYHEQEVEQAFRRVLPNDTVIEIRLKKWFSGLNQFGSVSSCLGMLPHFLRMREKTRVVEGGYIVRTDVELLRDDLSKWPTDKLCFLWRTAYKGLKTPVSGFTTICSILQILHEARTLCNYVVRGRETGYVRAQASSYSMSLSSRERPIRRLL